MVKDIKTKEVIKDIKTPDRKKNFEHFEKKDNVRSKQNLKNDEGKSNEQMNPKKYAVDKTISIEKQTAMNTGIKTKGLIKRRKKAQKQKDEQSQSYIKDKLVQKNKIKMKDKKAFSTGSKEISKHSKIKIRKNNPVSSQTITPKNYNQRMKLQMIAKHKKKVKETKGTSSALSTGVDVTFKFFKGTFGAVKKAATSVNNIITMGTGLILLIVITLFIGVFSALSDDSSVDTSSAYVSEEVLAYTATIEKYAKEYEIGEYVPLIQAVMMQESGGKGNDPMQSSECSFNEKYPQKPNGITDPDYSIKVGIHYLSECLKKANVKDPSDIENISLALQGYNYGNGYIQWAIDHFGGYTKANAKVFSDEMKAKLQTSVYGDPDYVSHVLRYYHLKDIVSIAKTQIGNTGGKKYWSWYGFNSRVSWCMIFISWCANESGDLGKSIYKTASVNEEMSWFKNHDKWEEKKYTPNSGDLIFFDWQQNGRVDHVGIVEKVEDGKVYTIEGNSSDEVKAKSYSLESKSIYGYGITK